MADIGHWRDTVGSQLPGLAYAGFDTAGQIRNDVGAGISKPNVSTFQITDALSLGRAKMFMANIKVIDSSNGRATYQARFEVVGGTGSLFTTNMTGYNRNTANQTAWVRVMGFLYDSSANCQVQLQWRRSTDTPTGGSVINASDVQIFDFSYSNLGHYIETAGGFTNGGVTETVLPLNLTITETNTNIISRASSEITLAPSRRYLTFWTTAGETGGSRTQRIGNLRYDGVSDLATRSYAYQRNAANQYCGLGAMDIHETGTSPETMDVVVYRGEGVLADQGGADTNGSWLTSANATQLLVIEIPWSMEVFRSSDSVGLQTLSGGITSTVNITRDEDVNVGSSFGQSGTTGMIANSAMDLMCWGNVWTARQTVGSGTRWTGGARIEITGVDQTTGEHGNYIRGNQGTQDTFAGSFHPGGVYSVAATDVIEVEVFDSGDNGAQDRTQPGTVGFMAINLDTTKPQEDFNVRIIA